MCHPVQAYGIGDGLSLRPAREGSSMRAMYRYEVPIDDQDHEIKLRGGYSYRCAAVLSPVSGAPAYVEFWAEYDDEMPERTETYRVFGTGHPVSKEYIYSDTAPRAYGLVFHLFEKLDG